MEKIKNFKDEERGRLVGGLILVIVGAALLLRNTGFFMPNWLFSWPMILILVGIYTGFKNNFRNNSWFIITAVGGFFLVSKFIPSLSLEPMFWPLVIIGLGIIFIVKPRVNRMDFRYKNPEGDEWKSTGTTETGVQQGQVDAVFADRSDYLVVESVFSGVNRNVVSKDFRGGHVTSVFGGAKIDLSQADIKGPVVIKLDVVFGGIKLIIPPHWAVQNEINGAFHGVDDKRNFNPSAAINPDKVLVLRGSAVFGGVEIRSY